MEIIFFNCERIKEKAKTLDYSEIVRDNRVVFLAESHSNTPIRKHISRKAGQLKAAGITHYAIEASDKGKPTFDRLNQGEVVDLSSVDVGPGRLDYKDAIYAMSSAGIKIVPIDIDVSTRPGNEEREAHITANIESILDSDSTSKVAVLIGAFHASRGNVLIGVPATGKRLMDKGVPTAHVRFVGGEVNIPPMITGPAQLAGKGSEEFMLDMRPYQNLEGVPFGKGESDFLIHLPQARRGLGSFEDPQLFNFDLSSLR